MPNYPTPYIPIRPVLDFGSISIRQCLTTRDKNTYYLTSARAGIALALQWLSFNPGSEVLLPAYHCTAMIEPVILCGLKPVFYKIKKNCCVDQDDLLEKLSDKTCAIIVTHYFGFYQDISFLRQVCDERNLVLIEDLAHVLYLRDHDSIADFSVWSAMKFFPVYEGGLLKINNSKYSNQYRLDRNSIFFQMKSILNNLEYSFQYDRLMVLGWFWSQLNGFKNRIWGFVKKNRGGNGIEAPSAANGGFGIEVGWVSKKMTLFSHMVVNLSSEKILMSRRRRNYLKILDRLSTLKGGHPLFDVLPENVVPYVFPLVVDHPEKVFPALKELGVPIVRFGEFLWEGVDETFCPISAVYSRCVFQFPCHQSLNLDEIEWMLDIIESTFSKLEMGKY